MNATSHRKLRNLPSGPTLTVTPSTISASQFSETLFSVLLKWTDFRNPDIRYHGRIPVDAPPAIIVAGEGQHSLEFRTKGEPVTTGTGTMTLDISAVEYDESKSATATLTITNTSGDGYEVDSEED